MKPRVRVIPPGVSGEDLAAIDRGERPRRKVRQDAFCSHCRKMGHTMADCASRKAHQRRPK